MIIHQKLPTNQTLPFEAKQVPCLSLYGSLAKLV